MLEDHKTNYENLFEFDLEESLADLYETFKQKEELDKLRNKNVEKEPENHKENSPETVDTLSIGTPKLGSPNMSFEEDIEPIRGYSDFKSKMDGLTNLSFDQQYQEQLKKNIVMVSFNEEGLFKQLSKDSK